MYCKIDDLNIYFEKYGESKKDVLLLHGWGQNTEMMAFIGDFLKDHFTVYNLDFPGFGKSDEMKSSWSVNDYKDFLRKFCIENNIDNPIIIGHSFGCRVAIRYAYEYPVYKMCLTGAAGLRDKRTLKWYFKTYSYKLGKKILSIGPLKKYKESFKNKVGSTDYQNASGVMRETLVKVVNDDIRELLPHINVETLLVFGEKDEATPVSKGKEMERLMPNAALVIFENDDHYAYINEAKRFNLVLDAFLKKDYE